jgi:hypothetical protein
MAFAITSAAAHEIVARVNFLGESDAAVTLNDSAAAPAALVDALDAVSAAAEEAERAAIGEGELARFQRQLEFRIGVGIYGRNECRPQDLVVLSGVQFALPWEMLEFLSPVVLDGLSTSSTALRHR